MSHSAIDMIEHSDQMGEIDLHEGVDGDVPEVVALLNRAYRGSGAGAAWTNEVGLIDGNRDSVPLLRREIAEKPSAKLMVWKADGALKGCFWLEPDGSGLWYLGSFAVDPQLQDRGFGRRLLAAAENIVRSLGGHTIAMSVIDTRVTLVNWYMRRGYRCTGETVPFPYANKRYGVPRKPGLQFSLLSKNLDVALCDEAKSLTTM